jgi:hypothetical protein
MRCNLHDRKAISRFELNYLPSGFNKYRDRISSLLFTIVIISFIPLQLKYLGKVLDNIHRVSLNQKKTKIDLFNISDKMNNTITHRIWYLYSEEFFCFYD